ncbi:UNVERIFIED_CONTAM: hypothetical protein RMT77_000515 [Armadillidium vulgare]
MFSVAFCLIVFSPLTLGFFFGGAYNITCPTSRTFGLFRQCSINETYPEATSLSIDCYLTNVNCFEGLKFEISRDGETYDEAESCCGTKRIQRNLQTPNFLARVTKRSFFNFWPWRNSRSVSSVAKSIHPNQRTFFLLYSIHCKVEPNTETTTAAQTTAEPTTAPAETTTA